MSEVTVGCGCFIPDIEDCRAQEFPRGCYYAASKQARIDAADRLAVKIVSLVAERISKDGKLYAYDGIEAAREIRALILKDMP